MGSPRRDHDDDDGSFTAPTPVRVATDPAASRVVCPTCDKPFKNHSNLELLRCAEQAVDDDDEPALVEQAPAAVDDDDSAVEEDDPDSPFEVWRRERAQTRPAVPPEPPPVTLVPTAAVLVEPEDPLPVPHTGADLLESPLPQVIRLPGGEIDYLTLAAAMREVLERERDEVVRRGGPIEKQNQQLKERLADALEEAAKWRGRAQSAAQERNSLKEQLDNLIRANRKERAQRQGSRNGERTKVVEIKDILKVVEATRGFTVKRQGNGHYGIYKDGVWVTDAASSGQGNKVDMATRVKLKKAGVDV